MTAKEVLEQVQRGTMTVEEADHFFQEKPYEDLGYARLDLHRQIRTGYPEVVFCQGKEDAYLTGIFRTLYEKNGRVMGTRASAAQAELVQSVLPEATYDPVSRILKVERPGSLTQETPCEENKARETGQAFDSSFSGRIAVCSGGTADIPVAEEAAQTAEFFGNHVERIYDVGVSGLHRLLSRLEEIRKANVVIAVAGMEGALAGVLAGLVENPVIAVPTSVGYGANLKGISALLTMINSCANGITVVNIDNGYGAGYVASQINRLAVSGGREASCSGKIPEENSAMNPPEMVSGESGEAR